MSDRPGMPGIGKPDNVKRRGRIHMIREPNLPVVLVILDGWGIGEPVESNAVWSAATPIMDRLLATYPNATLHTSGEAVGLPEGQMGNSEVGHLNIGAGHIVYQWITRIDRDIRDGTFAMNPTLRGAFDRAAVSGGSVHLMGLAGEGGVHAHSRHLTALIDMAVDWPDVPVRVHVFTDGRDTAPDSGRGFVLDIEDHIAASTVRDIELASLSGRYYAMDRDQRWERTRRAFEVITGTGGPSVASALDAIEASYAAGVTDEFIAPVRIGNWREGGNRLGPPDETIFFNFRNDRARQLTQALTLPHFDGFDRTGTPGIPLSMTTMTRYEEELPVHVAYAPTDVTNPIARVISEAGLRQFHTAETEKYPHVTFFLNGGREEPFPGEERELVPSPKVATYDLQPEMSARDVCDGVLEAIGRGSYHVIIVNFANPDMVGHTGSILATRKAVETVDACLGEIVPVVLAAGGVALVTADHGNAEVMRVPGTDEPMTSHTTNPVPVLLIAPDDSPLRHATLRPDSRLSAVGTTVIDLLGLPPHPEMTEPSLLAELAQDGTNR